MEDPPSSLMPDAANSQPPNLFPKPSITIQEIRESASMTVSSMAENPIEINACDATDKEVHDEPQAKKQKRTTSEVWKHYDRVKGIIKKDGKKIEIVWAKCNRCKHKARGESSSGTTALWNHLKNKHNILPGQQLLKVEKKDSGATSVEPYRYDQEASLKKLNIAIIMHEYPFNIDEHEYFVEFINSLCPSFPMKSRITIRKEIMEIYTQEKEKLNEHFKTVKCLFSTTMDMWTSNQNKGYMCVTVHWIDDDWHIQKHLLQI